MEEHFSGFTSVYGHASCGESSGTSVGCRFIDQATMGYGTHDHLIWYNPDLGRHGRLMISALRLNVYAVFVPVYILNAESLVDTSLHGDVTN